MVETTVPYNTQRSRARACKRRCPGGEACCLDGDVAHTLHICSQDEGQCECHSAQRYMEAKRVREVSNEVTHE